MKLMAMLFKSTPPSFLGSALRLVCVIFSLLSLAENKVLCKSTLFDELPIHVSGNDVNVCRNDLTWVMA